MNKKKLIAIGVLILVIIGLVVLRNQNFFGQGFVFNPGVELEVQAPATVTQDECMAYRQEYSTAEDVPFHTPCNAIEFEIGTSVDLENVQAVITDRGNADVRHATYLNFQEVMNANQVDSITWDAVSCAGATTPCAPGEYDFIVTSSKTDGSSKIAIHEFVIEGSEELTLTLANPSFNETTKVLTLQATPSIAGAYSVQFFNTTTDTDVIISSDNTSPYNAQVNLADQENGEFKFEARINNNGTVVRSNEVSFNLNLGSNECPIAEEIAIEHINLISATNETQTTELTGMFTAINSNLASLAENHPDFPLPELPIPFTYDNYISVGNELIATINAGLALDPQCSGITLPLLPELLTPADNATNVSVNPLFSWETHSLATRYGLVVSKSEDLTNPVITKNEIVANTSAPTNGYTLTTAETLDYNTKYYWTAYAANQSGSARYPHTFEFTTAASPDTLTCSITSDEGTTLNPFEPDTERVRLTYDSNLDDNSSYNFALSIKDSTGSVVASTGTSSSFSWPPTSAYIDWDGTDNNQNKVATGTYTAEILINELSATGAVLHNCTDTVDISLLNREGVEITVQSGNLVLGQAFELTTSIPFEHTKKVINVYDTNNNLLDTVTYACARNESCPTKAAETKFNPIRNSKLTYNGIKSNGEPIPTGTAIKFKLWAKPVRGSSSSDFSRLVNVTGEIVDNTCQFSDVPSTSGDYNAVQYVCRKGIFTGYPDGTMGLNERLTRAQLIAAGGRLGEQTGLCGAFSPYNATRDARILSRYRDINSWVVNDPRNEWKLEALVYTTQCGLIRGYADGSVQLDKIMTHAEWWKVALKAGRLFSSSERFDPWFKEYEDYLVRQLRIYPPNGLNQINRGDAIRLLYSLRNNLNI